MGRADKSVIQHRIYIEVIKACNKRVSSNTVIVSVDAKGSKIVHHKYKIVSLGVTLCYCVNKGICEQSETLVNKQQFSVSKLQ